MVSKKFSRCLRSESNFHDVDGASVELDGGEIHENCGTSIRDQPQKRSWSIFEWVRTESVLKLDVTSIVTTLSAAVEPFKVIA